MKSNDLEFTCNAGYKTTVLTGLAEMMETGESGETGETEDIGVIFRGGTFWLMK